MKDIHLQLPDNPEDRPGWVVVVNDSPPYDIDVYVITCKECLNLQKKLQAQVEENTRLKQSLERLRRNVTISEVKKEQFEGPVVKMEEGDGEDAVEEEEKKKEEDEEERIDGKMLQKKITAALESTVSALKSSREIKSVKKNLDMVSNGVTALVGKLERLESRHEAAQLDISDGQVMIRDMRAEITDLQCEITELKITNMDMSKGFKKEKREALSTLEDTKNRHAAALFEQLKELKTRVKEKERQQVSAKERLRIQMEKSNFFARKDWKDSLSASSTSSYESTVSSAIVAADKHINDLAVKLSQRTASWKEVSKKTSDKKLAEIIRWSLNDKQVKLRQYGAVSSLYNDKLWIQAVYAKNAPVKSKVQCIEHMWKCVSSEGGAVVKEEDLLASLRMFISRNHKMFQKAYQSAGTSTRLQKLTKRQTADLKMMLNLNRTKLQRLKQALVHNGIKIFPSLKKTPYATLCDVDSSPRAIEIGMEMLSLTKTATELSAVRYFKVKAIKKEISDIVQVAVVDKKIVFQPTNFPDKSVWMQISALSHNKSMTLTAKVVNSKVKVGDRLLGYVEANYSRGNAEMIFQRGLQEKLQVPRKGTIGLLTGQESQGPKQTAVRVFCAGEYEFLCDSIGHEGRSATHPCIWCMVCLRSLKYGLPHTPYQLAEDDKTWEPYHACTFAARRPAVPPSMGFGIVDEGLLPVPNVQRVPPVDHIITSVGNLVFSLLYKECRLLDVIEEGQNAERVKSKFEFNSAERAQVQSEMRETKSDLEVIKQDFLTITDKQQAVKRYLGMKKKGLGQKGSCMNVVCIESEGSVPLMRCHECSKQFHKSCASLLQSQSEVKKQPFQCVGCRGVGSSADAVLDELTEKAEKLQASYCELENKLAHKAEIFKKLEMADKEGPLVKELVRVSKEKLALGAASLDSVQLSRQQVLSMLLHMDVFVKLLAGHEEQRNVFHEVFTQLSGINRLVSLKRFLRNSEVNTLCQLCWDLGYWLPAHMPAITLEFHILVFHIPEFVQKWSTIGMFSARGAASARKRFQSEVGGLESLGMGNSFRVGYGRNVVRSRVPSQDLRVRKKRTAVEDGAVPAAKKSKVDTDAKTSSPTTSANALA